MIIRLRSRDGLERIEVDHIASVGDLKRTIHEKLNIPLEDVWLSRDAKLLSAKDPTPFSDLAEDNKSIKELLFQNGEMVYLLYHFERQVQPSVKPTVQTTRPYGDHMTIEDMIARQTRIERQETPNCASASFDRNAANLFQQYVSSALAFSIKRGGILYGTIDEERKVRVNAIYEPPQEGSSESLVLDRGTEEEQRADYVAELLGWKKVGWIYTQSMGERDYILSSEEVCQMASIQQQFGECAVTAVVANVVSEAGADVHFEAFQVSNQCVKLYSEGWFQAQQEPSGMTQLRNPRDPADKAPAIVAGKDVGEVDNDYFLIPVGILDHEGPLRSEFPIENRLLPQGKSELRAYLQKYSNKPYAERLADFHLLLYLAKQPNLDLAGDMKLIITSVKNKAPIPEGYKIIIDSLAGL